MTVGLSILLINWTEVGLALYPSTILVGQYVCWPADLLARQTAKPDSVQFSHPNFY